MAVIYATLIIKGKKNFRGRSRQAESTGQGRSGKP